MVRSFKHSICFILISFSVFIYAQKKLEISSKQEELRNLKNEISSLEKEIQLKNKKEKESFTILQNYDKLKFLLNKIIAQYRNEEKLKEKNIIATQQKIEFLTNQISQLQSNYAKYVNAVYRKQQKSDLGIIFDSESIAQAIRRIFYLRKFSEKREKDLLKLKSSRTELSEARIQLEVEREEKTLLVKNKLDEEKVLSTKTAERKNILNALRKDKNELKQVLDTKKKAEVEIRNLIARLTEEQLKREKELREKQKTVNKPKLVEKNNEPPKEKITLKKSSEDDRKLWAGASSFELLKGKMNWPVSNGRIIRKYGENKNPLLNTITLNYGVDIKAAGDLNIKSVSDGIVSAIEWIPGYGSIIIITHSDEYRTVYGHIDEILVQEGERINAGQIIATIGESLDGNMLHFEIWNSRTNQNPEIWLAKK